MRKKKVATEGNNNTTNSFFLKTSVLSYWCYDIQPNANLPKNNWPRKSRGKIQLVYWHFKLHKPIQNISVYM